ncbi:uncharacterized protein EAE97_009055 [Botrytis byssoidea]|uniref:Uncharacterized protein n=1 Tax=Botrytis byssoidea TaxID=139641 RepID=A0A9P5I541_9HELO|nr:uncharacterized protein EAE97_009055 [Botrytis byssoidea]KAF7932034.1 hypothetical protein EAE97_009055 [Botrytis byssoidea]
MSSSAPSRTPVLRLRPLSESDNPSRDSIHANVARDVARYYKKAGSASSPISVDIGPAYHPRFNHRNSWELESPKTSEPNSPTDSSFASPIESRPSSPVGSTGSMVTHASSQTDNSSTESEEAAPRDDESIKERDEATERSSNLLEQLLMEKSKSLILEKERDDAILSAAETKTKYEMIEKENDDAKRELWETRYQLTKLEKRKTSLFAGEKIALVQAERDQAILQAEASLKLQKQAEKEKDEGKQLIAEVTEWQNKKVAEINEARRVAAKRFEDMELAERERDDALQLASERLSRMNDAQRNALVRLKEMQLAQEERDVARQHAAESLGKWIRLEQKYEETKHEAHLLRIEIERMKEEKKGRGYWTYFLGALFD